MDCASLCLLSVAVAIAPAPDVQRCTYCLDVRGITSTCNHELLECVQHQPDFVLYCLTVNAIQNDDFVRRIVRCRSHSALNVSEEWTRQAMALSDCTYATSQTCNCSTCPLRETPTTTTITTAKPRPMTLRPSRLPLDKFQNGPVKNSGLFRPVLANASDQWPLTGTEEGFRRSDSGNTVCGLRTLLSPLLAFIAPVAVLVLK